MLKQFITQMDTISFEDINRLASDNIVPILREIIDNDVLLNEVAKNSYIHPNGFVKITLGKSVGEKKLRLHLWPAVENNELGGENTIHNHPWDFWSSVLFGSLTNEIYNPSEDSDALQYNEYECAIVGSDNTGHINRLIGKTKMKLVSVNTLQPGSHYFQDRGILHAAFSNISCSTTATLMVQMSPQRRETSLFLRKEIDRSVSNQPLPSSKLVSELENVIVELDKDG